MSNNSRTIILILILVFTWGVRSYIKSVHSLNEKRRIEATYTSPTNHIVKEWTA